MLKNNLEKSGSPTVGEEGSGSQQPSWDPTTHERNLNGHYDPENRAFHLSHHKPAQMLSWASPYLLSASQIQPQTAPWEISRELWGVQEGFQPLRSQWAEEAEQFATSPHPSDIQCHCNTSAKSACQWELSIIILITHFWAQVQNREGIFEITQLLWSSATVTVNVSLATSVLFDIPFSTLPSTFLLVTWIWHSHFGLPFTPSLC